MAFGDVSRPDAHYPTHRRPAWKCERPRDVPATPPAHPAVPDCAQRSQCRPMAACEPDSCESTRRAAARERLRAAQQVRLSTAGRCGLDGRSRRSSVAVAATAGEWVSGYRRRPASSDRAASMRPARSALARARASMRRARVNQRSASASRTRPRQRAGRRQPHARPHHRRPTSTAAVP